MSQRFQLIYFYKGRIISLLISVIYLAVIAKLYINVIFTAALYLIICLSLIWRDSMQSSRSSRPYSEIFQKGGVPYRRGSGLGVNFLGWILLLGFTPIIIYLMAYAKSMK